MRNLFYYYILILAPVGIMIWLIRSELINFWEFMGLIFFFSLIYQTYIDEKRTVTKNIIKKKDI